jgi:hypothetical protein
LGAVQRRRRSPGSDGGRWKTWASRLRSSPRRPPPALSSLTSETRPPSHRRPTSRLRTSPSWNASSVVLPLLLLLVLVAIVQASTRRRSTGGIRRAALALPPPRSTTAAAAGEAHAEDLHCRRRRRRLDRRRQRRRPPPPLPPGQRRPRHSKCRRCRRPRCRLIINLVIVMRNRRRIVSATFRTSNVCSVN